MIEYDTSDWAHTLFRVRGSVAPRIVKPVISITGWALVVVLFNQWIHPVAAPSTVHTLVGVAVGLLLIFRTNAAYERFWEGRKLWAGIVSETRNLGRMASAFLRDQPTLAESVVLWGASFPYVAMSHLRGTPALGPVASRLAQVEVAQTLAAAHPPTAVGLRISERLATAYRTGCVSDRVATVIDANVQLLVDYVGACERIQDTPLPFAYVAHLRLALLLYCLTLPFALVEAYGWVTVFDTMLIAYILFGIEAIGVEVENPFGHDLNDLPLEQYCATVERELLALIAYSDRSQNDQ